MFFFRVDWHRSGGPRHRPQRQLHDPRAKGPLLVLSRRIEQLAKVARANGGRVTERAPVEDPLPDCRLLITPLEGCNQRIVIVSRFRVDQW